MKTFLFFDDWMIQHRHGLERRWHQAQRWPGVERAQDPLLRRSFMFSKVEYDSDEKTWRMWASGLKKGTRGDYKGSSIYLYESCDGLNWQPYERTVDVGLMPHEVFAGEVSCSGGNVFDDPGAKNSQERYKLVYCDPVPDPPDIANRKQCRLATSADGVYWTAHPDRVWSGPHVDTDFPIIYNPYTRRYQWTGRTISGDRRIALYQTSDWKNFDKPEVVISPDPCDPVGLELYGMPQFYYEGYFLGFLWKFYTSDRDCHGPHRMLGSTGSELVYSFNGMNWNRTNREDIIQKPADLVDAFGSDYMTDMVVSDDPWLRIYNTYYPGEHGDFDRYDGDEQVGFLEIYRLRKDGFCSLDTVADRGVVAIRPVLARSGSITINGVTGRFGKIRAELRTVPHDTPIPGYELENAVAVEGDHHCAVLRWKDRDSITPLAGLPFRLYLELEQASVYAIRMDCDYIFEGYVHDNLAGDYQLSYRDYSKTKLSDYALGLDQ